MTTSDDWRQRLQVAVEQTLRKRADKAATRRDLDGRRKAGLAQRHTQKLSVADQAAIDPVGNRCRYLVSEDPPQLCPNHRVPGSPLCRPHLVRAGELARRLGLIPEED